MCNLRLKIEGQGHEPVMGYKAVAKRDGRYYSLSTGIEYKVGPVPDLPENAMPASIFMKPVREGELWYKRDMCGSTAVFTQMVDAQYLAHAAMSMQHRANSRYGKAVSDMRANCIKAWLERYKGYDESAYNPDIVILEMTIGDLTYEGSYALKHVMLGKSILAMREAVKTEVMIEAE